MSMSMSTSASVADALSDPVTSAGVQRDARNASPTLVTRPEGTGGLNEALLSPGAPPAASKTPLRIALLDNAKAALIYCVVLYHIAVVYTGADRPETPVPYASGFLMLLKPVVMPGFCLISGHVSRATLLPKHTRGLYQLVATYLLFQAPLPFLDLASACNQCVAACSRAYGSLGRRVGVL